jgi:hypothetical protein
MAGKKGQRSRKALVIDEKRSRVMRRGLDKRGKDARFMLKVESALVGDLGGPEELSMQKATLVKEAAFVATRLNRMRIDFKKGAPFDDKSYSAQLNSLIGLMGKLGLDRKAKKTLSAQELIARETSQP